MIAIFISIFLRPLSGGDKACILPTGFRFSPILDPGQPGSVSISSPQGPGHSRGLNESLTRKVLWVYKECVYNF